MSVFDEDVAGDLPDIFADAGDLATYQSSGVRDVDVLVVQDDNHEVYDQDQIAQRITTMSVQVRDVDTSRQGDRIVTPSRTWTVQQTLEDDGHVRRLYVS